MYQVNDSIVYGTYGVCRITEITQRSFHGNKTDYYVLKPLHDDNSTFFVPVNNEALVKKMRRILSEDEIYHILRATAEADTGWVEDAGTRRELFQQTLSQGDRGKVLALVKALHLHQKELQKRGKHLHVADERFLRDAEKMLYDEFSLVLHIDRDQVLSFILEKVHSYEQDAKRAVPKCS